MRIARATHLRTAVIGSTVLGFTLWASLGVALGRPAPTRIGLASVSSPSYAADSQVFKPVASSLLTELIGGAPSSFGAPSTSTAARTSSPSGSGPAPSREGPWIMPTDQPTPSPDPTPTPAPPPHQSPSLRVTMWADRATAQQGEEITYTIKVTNEGGADAHDVRVEAHVPAGTTLVGGGQCAGGAFTLSSPRGNGSPAGACVDTGEYTASNAPGEHEVVFSFGVIAGRASVTPSFKVKVELTTPDNAMLQNHAHASGFGLRPVHSNTVWVRVA